MKINGNTWNGVVYPIKSDIPVFFVADQSKSGYAYIVANVSGKILLFDELSGTGMKTEDFTKEIETYFVKLFSDVILEDSYIEQMILKKGLNFYHSSEVLHDIRVATKNIFHSINGKYPIEINNMSWKGAILPDGYRSRSEKGSKRFLSEVNYLKFGKLSDNMTDVYCMYMYVLLICSENKVIYCDAEESKEYDYEISIVPNDSELIPPAYRDFEYNNKYTIEQNAQYFVNRCPTVGIAAIDFSCTALKDIYEYCMNFNSTKQEPVLVVRRAHNFA